MKKYFLKWTFGFLVACALLMHITQANQQHKLEFEVNCPDSHSFAPIFKYPNCCLPYLQQLRLQFELDHLVEGCASELDKVRVVATWVKGLWQHNGDNEPTKSDPISILKEVLEHHQQFRCVEYSIVLAGCLNALGVPARILRLKTADVETREYGAGHVVVEAYLESLHKWIMIDAQANVIPVLNGCPLNAVELQAALADNQSGLDIMHSGSDLVFSEYANFIYQYLYYFQTTLESQDVSNPGQVSIMLVPIGAKNPTIFQRVYPIANVIYTHSVGCFYQAPQLSKT